MDMLYDYAIIGGDRRLSWLAVILIDRGFSVICYAVKPSDYLEKVPVAGSLKEAVEASRSVIAPIPMSRDGENIVHDGSCKDMTLDELCRHMMDHQQLFGGVIPAKVQDYCRQTGIHVYDLMKNEELTVFNTIATAEGAIAKAIESDPGNLHGSQALVLGFGRCAKTLAKKLKGLDVDVTIALRSDSAWKRAEVMGYRTVHFSQLNEVIGQADYIFNSVPAMVMDHKMLKLVKKDALIIDIASAPGGVDFDAAGELGIAAQLCLGLPGIYAPKATAHAIADTIIKLA